MSLRPLALCLLLSLAAFAAEPEDVEPPLVFFFEAEGGKRVNVSLDQPFSPAELGKSATLRLEPTRTFRYAGLELQYPRDYTFEAETSPGLSTWTLSGNDCKLIIQRYKGQKKPEPLHKSVVAEIRKAYGSAKSSETPVKLTVNGRTLEGTRLDVELASANIVQELYPFRSGNDVVELIIQDAPDKPFEPTPDRLKTQGLLEKTLKLPPAK